MKNKVLGLLLSVTMLASVLTGCGSGGDGSQGDRQPESGQQETGAADGQGSKEGQDAAVQGSGEGQDAANQSGADGQDGEGEGGEAIELTFWAWWSSEARKPYILEMVEGFNSSQSKYHVTYVDIGWGEIFTNNIAAIAAHNPCDIIANNMEEVKFRAAQGQMEPLDEYLTDDVRNGFYSQYLETCTGDDGKVYALPYSVDTRGIYYNKDHFAEAGINAEEIKTWDDLIAAARKLDRKEGDGWERIGYMPVLGNGGMDPWVVNANQGQGYFDAEATPLVDTEVNRDVLHWIRDQIDHYGQDAFTQLSEAYGGGMTDPFASGVLSMVVHTSAYRASLASTAPDLNYGVIPIPEYKEGNGNAVNGGGFVLEIPRYARNPEGAYEFIKYATSYEVQDFLSSRMGDFSPRNDFNEESEFFQDPIVAQLGKCLEETYIMVTPNEIKGYADIVNPELEQVTLGIESVEDALSNAQAGFEQFIQNNR